MASGVGTPNGPSIIAAGMRTEMMEKTLGRNLERINVAENLVFPKKCSINKKLSDAPKK